MNPGCTKVTITRHKRLQLRCSFDGRVLDSLKDRVKYISQNRFHTGSNGVSNYSSVRPRVLLS